jgi:hypothetical protein
MLNTKHPDEKADPRAGSPNALQFYCAINDTTSISKCTQFKELNPLQTSYEQCSRSMNNIHSMVSKDADSNTRKIFYKKHGPSATLVHQSGAHESSEEVEEDGTLSTSSPVP